MINVTKINVKFALAADQSEMKRQKKKIAHATR